MQIPGTQLYKRASLFMIYEHVLQFGSLTHILGSDFPFDKNCPDATTIIKKYELVDGFDE